MKQLMMIGVALLSGTLCGLSQEKSSVVQKDAKLIIIALGPETQRKYKHDDGSIQRLIDKDLERAEKRRKETGDPSQEKGTKDSIRGKDKIGKVPILLPMHKDQTPPSTLSFASGKQTNPATGKALNKYRGLNVSYNSSGGFQDVPSGREISLGIVKRIGADYSFDELTTTNVMAPGASYMMLMVPRASNATLPWKSEPRTALIRLDKEAGKPNSCRVFNYSSQPVLFALAGKKAIILPKRSEDITLPEKSGMLKVQAAAKGAGNSRLLNTGIRVSKHTQPIYIFHDTDPRLRAGQSVSVFKIYLPEIPVVPQMPE